ncbi:MAG: 4Fe-4S binding protein [Deltaproteobacteria bacterium]|jgi:transcriptional regulator of nitric oxide reductase|nr:4Fe-4S binding protein [Deltaproteobacteria bacterium]
MFIDILSTLVAHLNLGKLGVSLLLVLYPTLSPVSAKAGELSHETISPYFPSPFYIGEKDPELPVWVIYKEGPVPKAIGYAFESIDFAQIPGFAGSPMNLLVAIDTEGELLDVQILSQHEPVFVGGLGEEPLKAFLKQYRGKSLLQSIKVSSRMNRASGLSAEEVVLDGISKATVSVRIINQTVISTALQVARAKLGFAHGRDPNEVARVRMDLFEKKSWDELLKENLVVHKHVLNKDVQQLFAGTALEDEDRIAIERPDDAFIDLYIAPVSVPTIGHSLFNEQDMEKITRYLEDGDHAILVMSTGRYSFIDEAFVRGSSPRMLALTQDKLPMEMRDLDVIVSPVLPRAPKVEDIKVFQVASPAGLDPDLPWEMSLHVVRQKGIVYPEQVVKDIDVRFDLPERFVTHPEVKKELEGWLAVWAERSWEIAVLLLALIILSGALFLQNRLYASSRRLLVFRYAFYAFTLVFIGWYAQGQLSIVNFTALLQALKTGRSLAFYLYDPMTIILWAFVLLSLVIWGRGTFCGWLCPFGALQDFVRFLAKSFGVRIIRIKSPWNGYLKKLKYLILFVTLAAAAFSNTLVDSLVEIEPFKTAITVVFERSWPFVAYAVGLLLLGAFIYKFFCRYLCPLGAGLEILGLARRFNWLTRRVECGRPCQFCRSACDYDAIRRDGSIDYRECFQCLDCVSIYSDPDRCLAEIALRKTGRRMIDADQERHAGH